MNADRRAPPAAPVGAAAPGRRERDDSASVAAYHERTKHHYHRFAASLGYLDWATQPDPFRRYAGADMVRLPLPEPGGSPLYRRLFVADDVPPQKLSIHSASRFLRDSLSVTAWKSYRGTTWSLRANPSSGNLHPTEGYVVLPAIDGIGDTPAVYHYAPREHALERRAVATAPACQTHGAETHGAETHGAEAHGAEARSAEALAALADGSFVAGLASIHWREAWKYGERAFRYCQLDTGHALAALRLSAAALGWSLRLLDGTAHEVVAGVLGSNRDEDFGDAEREEPELLAVITPGPAAVPTRLAEGLAAALTAGESTWHGRANVLSPGHGVVWAAIDAVAEATRPPARAPSSEDFSALPAVHELAASPLAAVGGGLTAEQAFLRRRSAVAMDGATAIGRDDFYRMLGRSMPARDNRAAPWDALPWRPRIHLGLFVHRVDGLPAGLYALARDAAKLAALRGAMRREFRWERPANCPAGLPLFLLEECDCRALAASVSCGQDIAADGAFSLGMLADFGDALRNHGPAFYRNLYWEAGMVGQVLYLEAEESGLRATGIGCFFDDAVHEAFGIVTREWQSLYHFTVGGAVDDPRLASLPPYELDETRRVRER